MSLSNLNLLSESAYFSLLYDMIKQRENPWLYAGTGYDGIHNGGGDGNPTFGYGFNLAAFSASIVEEVILHAYNNSLTSQQSAGLDLILDWKTGASVWIDGASRTLTNDDILNLADDSLNGAPGAIGSTTQRAAVQSLTLTDTQATRMLDVMIKGDLDLVHIEGPSGSYGYEDGLDYRLAEEGTPAYSTERAALLSVYYNAPSLIGPGVQNAIANDDRAQLWYEIRYNHNHYDNNGLQNRRAEESDLLGLVSQSAKNNPASYIDEYASALNTLFNDDDRLGNRILTRIEARDALDDFQGAVAPELQALLKYYVLDPLGAKSAPTIEFVQANDTNIGKQMIASSLGEAGVPGGEGSATTVDLIVGGGGNDVIMGLGAADYLYGGAGDDTIYGDGGGTPVNEAGHDLLDGGDGDDSLIGGYGDEYMNGATGNDTLEGGAGADVLYGASGNDAIYAGDGNDKIVGGVGDDTLAGQLGNDTVQGGGGNDKAHGNGGDDKVYGGSGDDKLTGSAGADTLDGGDDNDQIFGNAGNDKIVGGLGDDKLVGLDGDDIFYAGGGNDTLKGGEGDDTLLGGGGADQFEFETGTGQDIVTDFSTTSGDVVALKGLGSAFDDFADVQAAATQVGDDTVIDLGGGETVTLLNVQLASLSADDFLFG